MLTSTDPDCIVRVARKQWTCVNCGNEIAPGESCVEYVGETSAFGSGPRYCAPCAAEVWAEFGVVLT